MKSKHFPVEGNEWNCCFSGLLTINEGVADMMPIFNEVGTHFHYYYGSEFGKPKPGSPSQSDTVFGYSSQSGNEWNFAPCCFVHNQCFTKFPVLLILIFCSSFDHFSIYEVFMV